MFFIVPTSPKSTAQGPRKPAKPSKRAAIDDIESTYYRRRVPTACDRCRLKKARCSGNLPCKKCERDGVLCVVSKDRTIDLKPKAPAYVKMVESQRDLLLRAVHELRQRSTARVGDPPDMNEVLRELNIVADDSETLSPSASQDLNLPSTTQKVSEDFTSNQDVVGFNLTDHQQPSSISTASMGTPPSTTTANVETNSSTSNLETAREMTWQSELDSLEGGPIDTSQFNDDVFPVQWNSTEQFFGYDNMASTELGLTEMDGLQEQMWQDCGMEFMDTNDMQVVT